MENAHDAMWKNGIQYDIKPSKAILHRIMDLNKKQSAFNILPLSVMFAMLFVNILYYVKKTPSILILNSFCIIWYETF